MPSNELSRRALLAGTATSVTLSQLPASAQTTPGTPTAGQPLLIRGATVLSMDPTIGILSPGDVLVKDGAIAAVERRIDTPEAQVIDGSGSIVLPGFVNGHIHLAQATLRGLAGDATLDEYLRQIVARYTGTCSRRILRPLTTLVRWSNSTPARPPYSTGAGRHSPRLMRTRLSTPWTAPASGLSSATTCQGRHKAGQRCGRMLSACTRAGSPQIAAACVWRWPYAARTPRP